MNNRKYDGIYYPVREVTDLKDMIVKSTDLYKDCLLYTSLSVSVTLMPIWLVKC